MNATNETVAIFNSDLNIYISRNDDSFPIVERVVSEGTGVCKDHTKYHLSPGRSNYRLILVDAETCDIDSRWQLIGQKIQEEDFFNANNGLYE